MPVSAQRVWLRSLLLIVSNLTIPLAILIFAGGFFPYKPFLPGKNSFIKNAGALPRPYFDKVIFMVVDALRSDFVYSNESSFFFTQSLIREGVAFPFTAHATSPTITMPRIKAMTTGSIPSFLDVILNFAESDTTSTLANQDTWPTQLRERSGGKLLMYGDDTWLKLFPTVFSRADGTSSFFVSDFTEVDHNVTRHLTEELDRSDWDGYIMHYLGLDHIGHKSGPRSPHMGPKQREMDGIVQTIFEAMQSRTHLQSTLLLLCGDHGMNDAGNHGGSSPGETSPALVFIAPTLKEITKDRNCPVSTPDEPYQYYDVVEQSDIAPTLAGLLGFPIPLNNLGVMIPQMLSLWSDKKDRIRLLEQNADQILGVLKATFTNIPFAQEPKTGWCNDPKESGIHLWCLWRRFRNMSPSTGQEDLRIKAIFDFLKSAQGVMSTAASNYDTSMLQAGVFVAGVSVTCAFASIAFWVQTPSAFLAWSMLSAISYGLIMFASSYIEEEHHFWYWLGSGWLVWLYATKARRISNILHPSIAAAISLLASFRILRRWNQTGQKFAGEPDIAKTFLPTQTVVLWMLVAATYIELARRNTLEDASPFMKILSFFCSLVVCLCAFTFKFSFTAADAPELLSGVPDSILKDLGHLSLITQARVVFAGIALLASFNLLWKTFQGTPENRPLYITRSLHNLLSILLVTQTRVTNIPLFLVFICQLELMQFLDLDADEVTMVSTLFQCSSFFALGGSNAISSIDLSSAYNGVDDYNVAAVAILTFISNWAGPIWWASGSYCLIISKGDQIKEKIIRYISMLTFLTASGLFSTMIACTTLRTHLFIWTVFSPKFLYTMAWSLGQHLAVSVVLGLLVWAVASMQNVGLRSHSKS